MQNGNSQKLTIQESKENNYQRKEINKNYNQNLPDKASFLKYKIIKNLNNLSIKIDFMMNKVLIIYKQIPYLAN